MRHPAMAPDGLGKPAPRPRPSSRTWPLAPARQPYRIEFWCFHRGALQSSVSAATPVTHLAKKPLPMRHKISDHRRNQLKERHF